MAVLTQAAVSPETVERVLGECAKFYAQSGNSKTITVFDREGGHYLLLNQGWDGFKRVHEAWAHVDIVDDDIWVQKDRTQDGIAPSLIAAGVSAERIVLAFQHPARRQYSEFTPS